MRDDSDFSSDPDAYQRTYAAPYGTASPRSFTTAVARADFPAIASAVTTAEPSSNASPYDQRAYGRAIAGSFGTTVAGANRPPLSATDHAPVAGAVSGADKRTVAASPAGPISRAFSPSFSVAVSCSYACIGVPNQRHCDQRSGFLR